MKGIPEVEKFIDKHGPTEAVRISGYARSTLYAWANGWRRPDPNQLGEVSMRLGIPKRKLRPDLFE